MKDNGVHIQDSLFSGRVKRPEVVRDTGGRTQESPDSGGPEDGTP